MLTARALPVYLWPVVIKAVFKGDLFLLRKYHVAAPCCLSIAVADTYVALRKHTAPDFVLYGLWDRAMGCWAGMVGAEKESNTLVTFGLGYAYRTREGVAQLAEQCCNLRDNRRIAYSGLYDRNVPAARFLTQLGFVPSDTLLTHPLTNQPGRLFTLEPTP